MLHLVSTTVSAQRLSLNLRRDIVIKLQHTQTVHHSVLFTSKQFKVSKTRDGTHLPPCHYQQIHHSRESKQIPVKNVLWKQHGQQEPHLVSSIKNGISKTVFPRESGPILPAVVKVQRSSTTTQKVSCSL